jgi:hypothetical protein
MKLSWRAINIIKNNALWMSPPQISNDALYTVIEVCIKYCNNIEIVLLNNTINQRSQIHPADNET